MDSLKTPAQVSPLSAMLNFLGAGLLAGFASSLILAGIVLLLSSAGN